METVCLSIREILWKNRSQSDSFLAGKPLRCVAFTCQDLCELVALICFLAIQHIIQVLPKCESSTGLVRRRGPALSSYHIAPSFLCLHFSSDFLREPLKIVLHLTDLIFRQVGSAVNISWDIVTILLSLGPLVNLPHLIHLSIHMFHQGICPSRLPLLMTFCSIFIKAILYLHSHASPHKIPKFSSGSKENTFQRSSHPLNFKQCYHSIIQQFFSRGPRPFLEEEYIRSTLIYSLNISYVCLCSKHYRECQKALCYAAVQRKGNVFLPRPGGNSARAEDRAVFHNCHRPSRAIWKGHWICRC